MNLLKDSSDDIKIHIISFLSGNEILSIKVLSKKYNNLFSKSQLQNVAYEYIIKKILSFDLTPFLMYNYHVSEKKHIPWKNLIKYDNQVFLIFTLNILLDYFENHSCNFQYTYIRIYTTIYNLLHYNDNGRNICFHIFCQRTNKCKNNENYVNMLIKAFVILEKYSFLEDIGYDNLSDYVSKNT